MYDFLNLLLEEENYEQLNDAYLWQEECDFQFYECSTIGYLNITQYRHNMSVNVNYHGGLCKSMEFYPDYVYIRISERDGLHGTIAKLILDTKIPYNSNEESLFQLSTVLDIGSLNMDDVKLFCKIRNLYIRMK